MARIPYARRTLTYDDVGATRRDDLAADPPRGFRVLEREARLGDGDSVWRRARHGVLNWQVQERSGFVLRGPQGAPTKPIRVDDVVTLGIRFAGTRYRFPAKVVYVVDEPDRAGFAYGTLRGHAESGEEAFLVERRADDSVWIVIRAFSRPAGLRWRLVDPVLRQVQAHYTRRYLRALRGAAVHEPSLDERMSSAVIGAGDEAWALAREEVLGWGLKRRAGFVVDSALPVAPEQELDLAFRLGPLRVREPVRVLWVVDERDRVGFGYGTRVGHPLVGEESFVIERDAAGRITLTVQSRSRPAGLWRAVAGPLRLAQRVTTRRYLRALR